MLIAKYRRKQIYLLSKTQNWLQVLIWLRQNFGNVSGKGIQKSFLIYFTKQGEIE